MEEIWKDIKGYDGKYQVSSLGNVKVLGNNRTRKEKILKPFNNVRYLAVSLCVNNIKPLKKIHRLVAETFIPNPESKPCVNHINGIKTDNRIENLEWVTAKENSQHAVNIGLNNPSELQKKSAKEANQKVSKWYNRLTKEMFIGNACELVRAFPEQNLHQGLLTQVRLGKRTHHKNWTMLETDLKLKTI